MKAAWALLVIFLAGAELDINAQACCSSTAPLLGTLENAAPPSGILQLNLTYDYNVLNDVYFGSTRLINDTRNRRSHSVLLEIGLGLTSRLAATGLFSYIRQKRTTLSATDVFSSQITTQGSGDIILLLQYQLIPRDLLSSSSIMVGAGSKFPTGKSDLQLDGIRLFDDLQPGSGSWDWIFWFYGLRKIHFQGQSELFLIGSFRLTGENDYGYEFGNEGLITLGMRRSLSKMVGYNLIFRYQWKGIDRRFDSPITNTGGQWIFFEPGINFYFTTRLAFHFSGQIPVWRNLKGIQLTTSYRLKGGVSYYFEF